MSYCINTQKSLESRAVHAGLRACSFLCIGVGAVWVRVSKVSLRRVLIAVRVRVRARALGGGSESREKDARL